jgi:hypothetical protein
MREIEVEMNGCRKEMRKTEEKIKKNVNSERTGKIRTQNTLVLNHELNVKCRKTLLQRKESEKIARRRERNYRTNKSKLDGER